MNPHDCGRYDQLHEHTVREINKIDASIDKIWMAIHRLEIKLAVFSTIGSIAGGLIVKFLGLN